MKQPEYYIVTPDDRCECLQKALALIIVAGIACGLFFGACLWARSTARGVTVAVEVAQ